MKKIKRLSKFSTFNKVISAIEILGYRYKNYEKGHKIGIIFWWYKYDSYENTSIYVERFVEYSEVIKWLNLELEDRHIIEPEEPEP